jgi:hypothetical protein
MNTKLLFFIFLLIYLLNGASASGTPNLYMDFNGDREHDSEWQIDSTTCGEATVEIWLTNWDKSSFSEEALFGVKMFFIYDQNKIEVSKTKSYANDTSNGGFFDPSFTILNDLGVGMIQMEVANFDCVDITDDILLYTLILQSIESGESEIEITVEYPDGAIMPGGNGCLTPHQEDCDGSICLINSNYSEECSCAVSSILGKDDPRLDSIRRFRDQVLSKNAAGRKIIDLYYKSSRKTIEILDKNPTVKRHARNLVEALMPVLDRLLPE